jgi:peptidoglycan-N-acetylglucosamine deacetylase
MPQTESIRYNTVAPTLKLLSTIIVFVVISCKNQSAPTLNAITVAASIPKEIKTPSLFNLYAPFNRFLNRTPQNVKDQFYFKAQTNKKIVALTFDDGPVPATKQLTNYLKQEKIPATFFVVAKNISQYNIGQYNDSLFTLGLHTYAHNDFKKLSTQKIKDDFNACERVVNNYHLKIAYYRPAFGVINKSIADNCQRCQLKGVLWNIDSKDWKKMTGATFLNNINKALCPGSIILMHDGVALTDLKALNNLLKRQDYKVVPLQELLQYKNEVPVN